jgi:hypothetical protein
MPVVLISGGTGLIGANLTRHLLDRNYDLIILTRDKNKTPENPRIRYSYWDVKKQIIDINILKEVNHIIHLAGAGVMEKKWTAEYKKTILESRTKSAELILKTLKEIKHQVKTFISASAIGWYGKDPKPLERKEGFIETDLPSQDFLGETCLLWEASLEHAKNMDIRLVKLRSGIVLSNAGGAFKEFKIPLRFGVATIFGNGRQILSWIHIDDLCRMYCDSIENGYLNGSYNAVSPEPVSQKKFMIALGEKLRHRFFIPVHIPVFVLKMVLGKRSVEILKSATVSEKKIKAAGFTFLYPTLDAALDELTRQKQ